MKSLNYLNNVMARIEANLAGADEALMLNDAGNVAECTADNVFIIKHGQIFTPPITAGALRGITRSVVFDIAGEFGIKVARGGHHPTRYFRGRRMFPDGNCCRDCSSGQSRWALDRKRKPRADHDAHYCALPRDDTRNRHADFRLRLTKADFERGTMLGQSCGLNFCKPITV